jgi:hypothetical protein
LEDLLRLKRAERPPSEFWGEFERQLRQKQLAALVEKKSWWHEFAVAYGRIGRVRLPLAATAVLVLTFLWVRYYTQPGDDLRLTAVGSPAHPAAVLTAVPSDEDAKPVSVPAPVVLDRQSAGQTAASVEKSTALVAEAPPAAPEQVSRVIPWLGDVLENRADDSGLTPSARSIAANLATAAVIEPELVDAVARPRGFEDRAMPVVHRRHTAEVLPTAAAVAEPRRALLLASLESAGAYVPEPSAPEHAKRSVTRYLAQDGWERTISRLETEGTRFSIKF